MARKGLWLRLEAWEAGGVTKEVSQAGLGMSELKGLVLPHPNAQHTSN